MTPSILNAAMCVLDVVFNALLIPHFGVMGAGMGTALACAVISLTMAWRCYFCNPALSLNRKEKGCFERNILQKALKIGTPCRYSGNRHEWSTGYGNHHYCPP